MLIRRSRGAHLNVPRRTGTKRVRNVAALAVMLFTSPALDGADAR
ncbi:hypothetical protein GCM10010981_17280 [Dyella nitratireducens]|uniref:Uncharacterized protein n=1 Tax=Dyella nitratireducens TaxID=1849580 RepID=A0ABQ1FSA4_9GAMM|nr:hypothetical protein GCM10010981_17280 [Dyella nitratireducens]GLQ43207.1 hypothetical protein GCM10007902_30570 [Dyella nitratireducens]